MAITGPCLLCGSIADAETDFDTHARSVNCEACGQYSVTEEAQEALDTAKYKDERFKLSGLTRRATDAGQPRFEITEARIPELLKSAAVPQTPFEVANRVVLLVHEYLPALNGITVFTRNDFPLFFARNPQELESFLGFAGRLGFVETAEYVNGWQCVLTMAGWAHLGELRKVGRISNQAFVAMWFHEELNSAYTDGIAPALVDAGYATVRVDREHFNEKIDDKIIAEIRRSGLLVADFTGERGGVYYEAGFALGLGLPVIFTVRNDDVGRLHFDTRQYNHIVWDTPGELRERLYNRVMATLGRPEPPRQL